MLLADTPPCCPIYTVMPGDTIASVAASQSVAPTALMKYNMLPAGAVLAPGQTLQALCPRVIMYAKEAAAGNATTSGTASAG